MKRIGLGVVLVILAGVVPLSAQAQTRGLVIPTRGTVRGTLGTTLAPSESAPLVAGGLGVRLPAGFEAVAEVGWP